MTVGSPLIIFDFDSTLIPDESLVVLLESNTSEQIFSEICNVTNQGINNEISMVESYERRLALGKPSRDMYEKYVTAFDVEKTHEMRDLLRRLKWEHNARIFCVSQGIQELVEELSEICFGRDLIEGVYAVPVEWNNEGILARLSTHGRHILENGKQWNVDQIKEHVGEYSMVIMVGDGVSDMKVDAQVRIAFVQWRDSEKTRELADYVAASVEELQEVLERVLVDKW